MFGSFLSILDFFHTPLAVTHPALSLFDRDLSAFLAQSLPSSTPHTPKSCLHAEKHTLMRKFGKNTPTLVRRFCATFHVSGTF